MEAQLEENKKELLWVRVLMGRPRPGQRRGLGGGQFCCLCRSGLCRRVCVYSPVCWSRHPTLGAGPDVVTRRWWAGARGSPRSKRLLVALTSQAGELLGIQLDLINAPQTDLRVPARGPWCPGVEVLASDVALESHMPNYWSRHGVCV